MPSEHFEAVSRVVNGAHWGAHVRLLRTGGAIVEEAGAFRTTPSSAKIRVTDGVHAQWLGRASFAATTTSPASRRPRPSPPRAVTKTGFVKDTHARYDKNDTRAVDDPRAWVLGMDNRAKLAALRAEEEIAVVIFMRKRRAITALKNEEAEASRRLSALPHPCGRLLDRHRSRSDSCRHPPPRGPDPRRARGQQALRKLAKAIEETRIQIAAVEEKLSDAKADLKTADGALTTRQEAPADPE